MKKVLPVVFVMFFLVTICYTQIGHLNDAFAQEHDFTISIALSPETIVLSNKAAGLCGIHADIGFWAVDRNSLKLSSNLGGEIDIDVAKPDSHDNLIVMVSLKKIKKELVLEPPSTTLTLSGSTTGGDVFIGSDIVRVKD